MRLKCLDINLFLNIVSTSKIFSIYMTLFLTEACTIKLFALYLIPRLSKIVVFSFKAF
jgi:hypothetical protein